MKIGQFIRLSFLPSSADCGLLVLRVWLGLSILLLHGVDKLKTFGATVEKFAQMGFPTPLGAAAVIAEGVCSALLVVGFATRWSAAFLAATMAVAFFKAHGGVLKGPGSGELAFVYLAGFVAIFIAGAGRWSVDAKLGK
jgi:putative oxidoreductase